MLQLIETICYENGKFHRLNFHNERLNRSRRDLFGSQREILLEDYLNIPENLREYKIKCRITYDNEIVNIEYQRYSIKILSSLRLVSCNDLDYSYKYSDRSSFNNLLQKKGNADEILMVKDNQITDTSYANIVFLKENTWFTPIKPLLNGTRRENYLQSGIITPTVIGPDDLKEYSEARIINAMISLEDSPIIQICNISW